MSKRKKKPTRSQAAPAVAELTKHGWCRRDAEHLIVLETALRGVGIVGTDSGRLLSEHAATVLRWEPVLCGAKALYTESEHAPGWRALAGFQEDQPMRTLMLQLAAESEGCTIVDGEEGVFTAEDLRLVGLAVEAENRGDFEEALRLLRLSHRPLDDQWTRDLERVVSYGEQLSSAQWGRWICSAALRWCQSTTRGLDLGVHYASVALRSLGAPEQMVREHAPSRAGFDQIVHDALLFDEGSLRAFLERELAPMLADKVPGIESWPVARPAVVRLLGRAEQGALCEDVLDGQPFVVGDELFGDQHPAGRLFFGRLVQVMGDDRQFFATLPTVVDDECAALDLAVAIRDDVDAEQRIDLMHSALRSEAA